MFLYSISQGNLIATPAIKGTILPGITRKSIIDVAVSQGFQVSTPTPPLPFVLYKNMLETNDNPTCHTIMV